MAETEHFTSPADIFLQQEVYRLGSFPGLRSLPPGPTRDFLVTTWGPIVYRTSYTPANKHLLPVFLRCLNDAVSRSLHRTLTGPEDQIHLLENTYASRVFSSQSKYGNLDEDGVREAFREYKVSLAIPATELPSRMRACLMVDDGVLAHLTGVLDMSSMTEKDANFSLCWVKVIEENFPDSRFGDAPYVTCMNLDQEFDGTGDYRGIYRGWTMVALSALVEVFDGLRQMKYLVEYHREGRVYLGDGRWSSI